MNLRTLAIMIAGIFTYGCVCCTLGAVFTGFGDYNEPAPKLFGFFFMDLLRHLLLQCFIGGRPESDVKAGRSCSNPAGTYPGNGPNFENNNIIGYPSIGFLSLVDPVKETFFEYLFIHTRPGKPV